MPHPRQQIRDAAVAQLKGKTLAGDRVSSSRDIPWRSIELPAISVYTDEEKSEASSVDGDLHRVVKLVVLVVVEPRDEVDDYLDDRALEVEQGMAADATIGGHAEDSVLVGTKLALTQEQRREVGAIELTYDVEYFT